jgi:hypothetical protein
MRFISRLFAALLSGLMVASLAGTVAAFAAKRRIVPHDDPDADEVTVAAIFEPLTFRSRARSFRGGTLDCWYGGGVVDLREATLDPAGATLRVRAIFGGGQILVPETWRVKARVLGIGGLGDARPPVERPDDAPLLTIEGLAVFGGFGVMSELPEQQARWMNGNGSRMELHPEPTEEPAPPAVN